MSCRNSVDGGGDGAVWGTATLLTSALATRIPKPDGVVLESEADGVKGLSRSTASEARMGRNRLEVRVTMIVAGRVPFRPTEKSRE